VIRHFCGTCASRLFTTGDLPGPLRIFQSGTREEPNSVMPQAAIYVKDPVDWDVIAPGLAQYPMMGPLDWLYGPQQTTPPSGEAPFGRSAGPRHQEDRS
jgi:hypothetical protein